MMSTRQTICLGYTTYREEVLPLAAQTMLEYPVVALEEPKTPGFESMLNRELDIDTYLELTDYEFPEYAKRSCAIMQDLTDKGVRFLQIDPFMDELVGIHEFFVSGSGPEDIPQGTVTAEVYWHEHRWTAALIEFYKQSRGKDFQSLVASVQEFARQDALRGRLRDRMRAEALKEMLQDISDMYVEVGYIHVFLGRELRRLLPGEVRIKPVYLMEAVVRAMTGRRQVLAPGDILTHLYTFHPDHKSQRADLLAAQSLVYNKVVAKEELENEDPEAYPHLQDEIEAISLSRSLSYTQCRDVYFRIRSMPTSKARETVREWQKGYRQ